MREPRSERVVARGAECVELRSGGGDGSGGGGEFFLVRGVRHPHGRRGRGWGEEGIETSLVDVLEKRGECVEIFLRNGVELVIVAATALEGEAEEGGAEGGHAVVDVIDAVFLLDGAALGFLWVEAVEGGGEDLFLGGVG